jgi:hypothetical protein
MIKRGDRDKYPCPSRWNSAFFSSNYGDLNLCRKAAINKTAPHAASLPLVRMLFYQFPTSAGHNVLVESDNLGVRLLYFQDSLPIRPLRLGTQLVFLCTRRHRPRPQGWRRICNIPRGKCTNQAWYHYPHHPHDGCHNEQPSLLGFCHRTFPLQDSLSPGPAPVERRTYWVVKRYPHRAAEGRVGSMLQLSVYPDLPPAVKTIGIVGFVLKLSRRVAPRISSIHHAVLTCQPFETY